MKRCFQAALVLAAVWVLNPAKADSAGVFENAAAESAFLLAPDTISVRASLESTSGSTIDGTVYRFYAAFPIRRTFLVAVEQPLVSTSKASGIDSGLGDLTALLRGRVMGIPRGSLFALASLGTGTGAARLYPYATESVDFTVSAAATDSIGVVTVWGLAALAWAQRVPDVLVGEHRDTRRVGAGAGMRLGPRAGVRGGITYVDYVNSNKHREIVHAAGVWAWTPALRLFAQGQMETGPVGERASDWALSLGADVWFGHGAPPPGPEAPSSPPSEGGTVRP